MTDCIFCKIIAGEIPSQIVYQDADAVAIRDITPVAPKHILVIPRRHVSGLNEVSESDAPLLAKLLLIAKQVAVAEGIESSGYRVVINTGNDGGQSVHHLHVHVLGGRQMAWPPG